MDCAADRASLSLVDQRGGTALQMWMPVEDMPRIERGRRFSHPQRCADTRPGRDSRTAAGRIIHPSTRIVLGVKASSPQIVYSGPHTSSSRRIECALADSFAESLRQI